MSEQSTVVKGLTLEMWEAIFRPGIVDFAGSNFAITGEGEGQVRIAFGNAGPCKAGGQRTPVFTYAVTLPTAVVVNLAEVLLKHCAAPSVPPAANQG